MVVTDQMLATVARRARQVIILTGADRKITWVNDAFTEVTGYRREEVLGLSPGAVLQREGTCPETVLRMRAALDAAQPFETEILNFCKDGSPYWIVLTIEPVFAADGTLEGFVGINEEITDRKGLEVELRQSRAELRELEGKQQKELTQTKLLVETILRSAPVGIVVSDPDDVIRIVNPAAERMLGWTAGELVGKATPEILHPRDDFVQKVRRLRGEGAVDGPLCFAEMRDVLRSHLPLIDEWTHLRKDGSTFRALLALSEVKSESGDILGYAGIFMDLSELRAAEREAARQSQLRLLLSEMAAQFIDLPLSDVEGEINRALAQMGEFFGVDRSYIFKYDHARWMFSCTHEWCAPGIKAVRDDLQNLSMDMAPEWQAIHEGGREVWVSDVSALPESEIKRSLLAQEIKSLLLVPMMLKGECVGFVGFDSVRQHRAYSVEEKELLTTFSKMLLSVQLRQQSQRALEHSEQRLQNVIDSAGEFVWETDAGGRLIYLSALAAEVFAEETTSLLGLRWDELCHEEDREVVRSTLQRCMATGQSFRNLHLRARGHSNQLLHLRLNGRPAPTAGEEAGMIGLTLDITRESVARMELDATRHELEQFFELSLDLISIFDGEARFVRCNRAWEQLLGVDVADLVGRKCLDFVHPEDVPPTVATLGRLHGGEIVNGFLNRYRTRDGDYRTIEWYAKSAGDLIFASARDVTERENTRLALQRALQEEREASMLKANLLSMASHEFRTPLASLRLSAEFVADYAGKLSPGQICEQARTIVATADYMTEIVKDVLDLQHLGHAGFTVEEEEEFSLRPFLEDVVGEFCRLDQQEHEIVVGEQPGNFVLRAPKNLLQRIIGNLLQNAAKYSPAGSRVVLDWRSDSDGGMVLSVADEGIGVPPEESEFLFEPFFRAANASHVKGTGLGLPICQAAAERIGGWIAYEPNMPRGSVFSLHLPCGSLVDGPATPSESPHHV